MSGAWSLTPALLAAFAFLLPAMTPSYGADLSVSGIIRAQEEVVVRSETPGVVSRIAVREGEQVQEGQLLVELDNDRQEIVSELSQASYARAKAALAENRVLLENARKDLARVKIAGDALPRKELEDREDQVLRLEASLEAREAELKQAEADLSLRQNDLKDTRIVAPFSGTVTRIYLNQGDALKPWDTPVLELVALERLYAELVLPVAAVLRIQPGQKVRVNVENDILGRAGLLEGKVIHVNPKVDASSRTFRVKVGFADSNGKVRPGMFAQVGFTFSRNHNRPSRPAKGGGK